MKEIIIIVVLLTSISLLLSDGIEPEGNGTEDNPYQIANLDNLLWISTNQESWGKNFIQIADINASDTENWNDGKGFNPIGYVEYSNYHNFYGVYDGQNHIINSLYINRDLYSYDGLHIGLFGYSTGTIKNLRVNNINVIGRSCTGGLVGTNSGVIINCSSSGAVNCTENDGGGLVGKNGYMNEIYFCYSDVTVLGGDYYTGGLVGYNEGIVKNCYNLGNVDGHKYVGGLVGYNKQYKVIDKSYSIGDVTGDYDLGGLVGAGDYFQIKNSFWDIESSGQSSSHGGMGLTSAEMKNVSTYTDSSSSYLDDPWDFVDNPYDDNNNQDIWDIDNSTNEGYPVFSWQIDHSIIVNSLNPNEGEIMLNETESQIFEIDAEDPDGNDLEYSWVLNDTEVSTESNYEFATNYDSAGIYELILYVTDNFSSKELNKNKKIKLSALKSNQDSKNSLSYTWNIIVNDVDQEIIVNSLAPEEGELELNESDSQLVEIDAEDPDGNEIEYSWKLDGIEVSTESNYEFTTDYMSSGNYSINLEVTDNYGGKKIDLSKFRKKSKIKTKNIITFNWNVNVNNSLYMSLPDTLEINEDEFIVNDFTTNITDYNDGEYTLNFSNSEYIEVTIDGYNITFTPLDNWSGSEDIDIILSENNTKSSYTETVTITVNPINDVPTVENPISDFSFDEDTVDESIDLNNVFNDVDLDYGDELTYSYVGNENIDIQINSGIVTLIPTENWFGEETVIFTATDNSEETTSDEVAITVNSLNDSPIIELPETLAFDEDGELTADFTEYLSDVDSEILTLTADNSENISVVITEFTSVFTAEENWSGTETINFTVNDNESRAISTDEIEITVNPVNDIPILENTIADFSFDEDTVDETINLNNVFTDVDLDYGDELNYSFSGNENITVEIADGVVTLTPAENWFGEETVTFIATDNSEEVVSDEVIITVNSINDEPEIISYLPEELEFEINEEQEVDFSIEAEDVDSELEYSWFVNDNDAENNTNSYSLTFSENGEYEIKVVISDEDYDIQNIWNVNVLITSTNDNMAKVTKLIGNYPNPFNPETTISYSMNKEEWVKIEIFNVKGKKIKTLVESMKPQGNHSIKWKGIDTAGNDVASGIYFYRMKTDNYQKVRKLILMK